MGYRGEDLDLRTPQMMAAAPYAGQRGGPIWVDEVVLDCSNHAYEVALAHRSGEVRLEHLLHALTLVGAAVESLEARGIRTAGLRRDTGTLIASETPTGLQNGKGLPRRSDVLEDVLRLAADYAARRNAPATVDDLLYVLIDLKPELPGAALLHRHATQAPRETSAALPPLTRSSFPPLSRVPFDQAARERLRAAPAGYHHGEAPRADPSGTATDSIRNSRLDTLEQMVRELLVQRDDALRLSGGLHDRFQSLEALIASRGEAGTSPAMLDRLQTLEYAVEQRLEDLGRTWSHLSDRLQGLEQAIRDSRSGVAPDLKPLEDRLGALERSIQTTLADKLKTFEASLGARATGSVDLTPVVNRLDIIEEAVLTRDTSGTGVAERLRAVEEALAAERAEASAAHAVLKSDIKALTGALISGPLVAQMTGFSTSLENRQAETARGLSQISDRLTTVDDLLGGLDMKLKDVTDGPPDHLIELRETLSKLGDTQSTLATSLDQWRLDSTGDIGVLGNRIEALEREAGKPMQLLEQLSSTVDAMYGVTVARYHRRNQFWYWLFGTDDWVAASWRSQASLIEEEKRMVKTLRTQYRNATKREA